MSSAYVLLQFSSDPWNARFEDLENRLAFSVCVLLLSLGFRLLALNSPLARSAIPSTIR